MKVEKIKNKIRGSGGDDPPAPHIPTEANDTLQSTAYLRIVDIVCEGEIEGLVDGDKSIYLNETQLKNDAGNYNFTGVSIDGRTGTQSQTYMPGFAAVENEIATGIEVKYGTGPGGDDVRQITDPSVNRVRVRFSIPQLTETSVTTGDITGSACRVGVYVQPNGGSYTLLADRTISGKSSSKFEFSTEVPLSGSAPWNIKVSRLGPDATTSYSQNKTFFESYTEIIDAKLRYPNTALIGMKLNAKAFNSVPARYYDVKLLKIKVPSNYNPTTRAYSGSWDGTFQVLWSDNPAWVFYDLLTNERYGLGGFIPEDQVDKWALYTIAQYCDTLVSNGFGGYEPRFTCNMMLASRQEAYTVLQNMASIFRGMIYWSAGTVTAVQDSPQDAAYLFTSANVVDGRFAYQGASAKTRHTVALVSWNDPDDFYRLKVEYVEDQDGIARFGVQETQIVAMGCTSRGQAHRLGKWLLYTEQNEAEMVTFKTGLEGIIGRPGQVIKISDAARAGGRFAGRIHASTTTTLTVDSLPAGSLTGNYISATLPDASIEKKTITSVAGNVITVNSAFSSAPNPQGVWMIETGAVVAQTWRVLAVKEEDEGQYTISAIKHDPDKFAEIESNIILEPKSYSILSAAPASPVNLIITESLYQTASEVKTKISISWDRVDRATGYLVKYKKDNDNFIEIPETAFNDVIIYDVLPGIFTFQVSSINSLGRFSTASTVKKEIFGKTSLPADVTNFSMFPSSGQALLTWNPATDLDVIVGGYVVIRHTPNITAQAWKDAVDLVTVAGNTTSTLAPLTNGTYMIKFVDSSGNYSSSEKLVVTTVPDAVALNVVQTITESPTFPGTRTNMDYLPDHSAIALSSNINIDDTGPIDDLLSFDYPSGINFTGEYAFQNTIDLAGVWPFSIRSTLKVQGFDIANQIDSYQGNIDDLADFDGAIINDVSAEIQIRTTEDNPAGSPTWTAWKKIVSGDYSARGIQLKLVATSGSETHNIYIQTLQVVIDMKDRTYGTGKIASGTSGYNVVYDSPFYALPTIGITEENMSTGDYKVISAVTTSGFTITFKNAAGTNVDRNFYVLAKGYGRKTA